MPIPPFCNVTARAAALHRARGPQQMSTKHQANSHAIWRMDSSNPSTLNSGGRPRTRQLFFRPPLGGFVAKQGFFDAVVPGRTHRIALCASLWLNRNK
jgi:hypothetical protein